MSDDIKLLVGVPSGGSISEGTAQASFHASLLYPVIRQPSCESGPNFNAVLAIGLNAARKGLCTHLVTLHADVRILQPDDKTLRWADVLVAEAEAHDADFLSVPNTIKDSRGLTSSGVGNPDNPWNPWRRWTTAELDHDLPPTFDADMVGYGDKYLLHNNAVALWDLRKPLWWETDEHGCLKHTFNFVERLRVVDGEVVRDVDSEDWHYSRHLWQMGARTFLTSKLTVYHTGSVPYPNKGDWGTYENGDEDTAPQWRNELLEQTADRLRAQRDAGELIEV